MWTNTALFLLRGSSHLFASVAQESLVGSREWFSQALSPNNLSLSAIGQAGLQGNGAQLNWLLSLEKAGADPLPNLLDHIAREAGLRGARYITAGAKVEDCSFEILRRAGYCAYSWQLFWEFHPEPPEGESSGDVTWRRVMPGDTHALESLQRRLLAPAVQAATQLASSRLPEFILEVKGEIHGLAYVDAHDKQVMIKPLLNKDLSDIKEIFFNLIDHFFQGARTLIIMQTSDQNWMTEALTSIAKPITQREELLVKHFSLVEKVPVSNLNHATNGRRTDTVTPMLPTSKHGEHL